MSLKINDIFSVFIEVVYLEKLITEPSFFLTLLSQNND